MRDLRLLFPTLLAALTLAAAPLAAQEPDEPPPGDAPAEQEAEEQEAGQEAQEQDGLEDFDDLVEGAEAHEGYFDLYVKDDGKVYMAVPTERLGQPFLMKTEIARGVGAAGLYGGTMLDLFEGRILALERHGQKVFLTQRPHRYTAGDEATRRAVELSFGASILQAAEIASVRDDSALVLEVRDWFVSDLSGVGRRVQFAVSDQPGQPGRASLDKARSYLEWVKSFPENTDLQVNLTFKPGEPAGIRSVPDGRFVPVAIHYTLAKLPERPMTPREADDRVGYFMTVRKDFSQDADDETFFRRYVNRWRLEPGRRVGDLWEPEEPIVYYLDRNIPQRYREYVAAGIEAWNRAFEAAGWRDAIRAELLPEGAHAEDIRYPTVRWNTSDQPGYGAIGPSTVDPRTGEIMDADILVEAAMVMGFRQSWRTLVDPATALRSSLEASPEELASLAAGGEAATLGAELVAQGGLLRSALVARGGLEPGEPVPEEYVGEALKWVIMHEVGHTLGLRHNFRSSADTPLERLYDGSWTRENGVFGSVMEYPTVNLNPDGETPHHYNPGVGSYDRWAVAYGYTPEPERAAELARQGARDGHAYGTDEDARGPGALDPTVNVYDLGEDPLAWSRQRAALIRDLWDDAAEHALEDDARYAEVTDALQTLLGQYARALAPAVKYVGGQYQYRDHAGDPDGRPPFVNVDRARQVEALAFLSDHAFDEDAFAVPPQVLQKLGADRWSHWGNSNTFDGRIDFPLREQVLEVQRALLSQLTHPFRLARIRDAEAKFGAPQVLSIPELMRTLTDAVWSEVLGGGGRDVAGARRDLQRAHLDRLVELYLDASPRTPADARSVARLELARLGEALDGALEAGGLDAYTRAHLAESRARVEKALEAGLEAQLPGSCGQGAGGRGGPEGAAAPPARVRPTPGRRPSP